MTLFNLNTKKGMKAAQFFGMICIDGNCTTPVKFAGGAYCDPCQQHVDDLNNSESSVIRERAYLKHNIKEWKTLMRKYPDIR